MEFIVLSSEQKTGLEELRDDFTGEFVHCSDFVPIEIKNNLWILPLSVLSDPDLQEFNDYVMTNKTSEMVIREVLEDEFIIHEI